MIIYRAGHRISLYGGGSDYSQFIRQNEYGYCIGLCIDSYSYVSIKKLLPFNHYRSKITYTQVEMVNHNSEIKHNAIRTCIEHAGLIDEPLEINFVSDLPGGCGLGSSSSLVVALTAALHFLKTGSDLSAEQLIFKSFLTEYKYTRGNVGYQDVSIAVLGGLHEMTFGQFGNIDFHSYNDKVSRLFEKYGLLFYTGVSRNSSDVVSKYIHKLSVSAEQEVIRYFAEIANKILRTDMNIENLAWLLEQSWEMKKRISPHISTPGIDWRLHEAKKLGSLAGKLCGGGQNGSLFLLAEPDKHTNLIELFVDSGYTHIPWKVSPSGVERILP